jgi:glyoxylase-like metal-dependent hydrolase (beta-lactamase superfamily II)
MNVVQVTGDGDTTTPGAAEQLLSAGGLYDSDRFTANAFLVRGARPVLVDAGTLSGVESVVAEFTDSLDAVVLTHQHGDHIGELDAVLDAFDPELYAYGDHPARTHELEDGDEVVLGDEAFEVLHTPGHAPDHVVLYSASMLFAGDLVSPNDQAFDYGSFGATGGPGPAREQLIESLERLLEHLPAGVEHLYSGHGDAFHGDVRDLVETALERAAERAPKYPDR